MYQIVLLIHVFAAVCIIALVLVQQGRGASVGAAFGSGASQTVFGSRGSGSFLFRVTMSLVGIFFITSLAMNYMAMQAYKHSTVVSLPAKTNEVPAAPASQQQQAAEPAAPVVDAANPALKIPETKLPMTLPAQSSQPELPGKKN